MDPSTPLQTAPQPQIQPVKKGKAKKVILAIFLVLVIAGLAGYGVFAYMKNTQLENDISQKDESNKVLMAQNDELKAAATNAKTTDDITEKLPNGQMATFPNNEGNRNMLFWSAGSSNAEKDIIVLSHKGIQAFLSAVDSEMVTKLCGTDANLKALKYNISIAILNTETKTTTSPQNGDCVTTLASNENMDAALRAKAQSVIDTANTDMRAFIKSVTIQ